jgi:hypothetical protein
MAVNRGPHNDAPRETACDPELVALLQAVCDGKIDGDRAIGVLADVMDDIDRMLNSIDLGASQGP